MTSHKTARHLTADLLRLDRETDMLIATVASLTESELTAPSLCAGWSRAHVVAHLARNADSLVNLCHWATTGVETPQYPSPEARERGIEASAAQDAAALKADLTAAVARCRDAMHSLGGPLAVEELPVRAGLVLTPYDLPSRRTTEVILHHADLDTVWDLAEADPESLLDALEDGVRRVRASADRFAGPGAGLTLSTDEGDEWVLGDGTARVHGERDSLLAWISRGRATENLELTGADTAPALPSWG